MDQQQCWILLPLKTVRKVCCNNNNDRLFTEPSTPKNESVTLTTSTSAVISWSPPLEPNGVIIQYRLQCGLNVDRNVSGSQTTITLSGLLPYTNYSCNITAHTSAGRGPAATVNITTAQDG